MVKACDNVIGNVQKTKMFQYAGASMLITGL